MAHIESSERQITTPNEAPHHQHIQFEGYAAHPGAQGGKSKIGHHGRELHMGNAYESAKPDSSSHCFGPCEKAKHWHPKENDHSGKAKEWRKNFGKQDHEKLTTDKDHHYEVKSGDAIGSIARRALEGQGHAKPTHEQVAKMEKEIVTASQKDNPTLECNPELIKPGMKLTVPPEKAQGTVTTEGPGRQPAGSVGQENSVGTGARSGENNTQNHRGDTTPSGPNQSVGSVTGHSPYGALPDRSQFAPKEPQTPYTQFPMSINPSFSSEGQALNDHAAGDHSAVKLNLNPHRAQ